MKRLSCLFHLLVLFLVGLDQFSKTLIEKNIFLYQKIEVIPGLLNLTRIHNRGIIFGAFSNLHHPAGRIILTLLSFVGLAVVIYFYLKTPVAEKMTKFSFSLILAGALGNLIDRVTRGYVVDFIDFHLGRYHWPYFNLADSFITVGGLGVILLLFISGRKRECCPSS
ncbi:MAG: signal peptidase II [Candidatus Aminicenantes bacterium]|nr:signal peptidase II [Candidatus Aminicenantes bacterium]